MFVNTNTVRQVVTNGNTSKGDLIMIEHSPKFNKVKYYFDHKLWSIERVREAVVKSWITQSEYEEITSEPY